MSPPVPSPSPHPLLPTTRLSLRPLSIHREDEEFIVGWVDAGTFAAMEEVGVQVIRLLQQSLPLGDVQAHLAAQHDAEFDLERFVEELVELDFVEAIDGQPLQTTPAPSPHLPRIAAQHVSWLFRWPSKLAYAALMSLALLTLVRHPELLPSYRDFSWAASSSLVLAGNALWLALNQIAHELAHLLAARSLAIPARIELSTRLHHLVAQTDLSSLWSVPRRRRFRVYLAGIQWDLVPIAMALLLSAYVPISEPFKRALAAVMLINWLGIIWQFHLYLRTDIYYVVLELVRGRNLYQDSLAYLSALGRRLLGRISKARAHPSELAHLGDHSAAEFRQVKIYAGLIALGSALSLSVFLAYGVPVLLSMIAQAAGTILLGVRTLNPISLLDGGLSMIVLLGGQVLFLIVLLRNRKASRPSVESPSPIRSA